jgi:peptidoglycan/xylan/chitin deacetylase (PgdA/CDA1 family)
MRQSSNGSPVQKSASISRARSRQLRLALAAIVCGSLIGIWYSRYHGTGWTNAVNPVYWLRRARGVDLYRSDAALLLHGNRNLPEVALTFDDGPHPESRGAILDILHREHIHATFFDVGINMAAHPDLVERTISEGNEIGNHSQDHMNRLDVIDSRHRHYEINDADILYASITGKHLSLLRPPGMRYNDEVLKDTHDLGYIVVGYTTASRDFDPNEKPHDITERTLSRAENGSIILLHDYAPTAAALPDIISGLKAKGLRCVTISEMISHLPEIPKRDAEAFLRANSN